MIHFAVNITSWHRKKQALGFLPRVILSMLLFACLAMSACSSFQVKNAKTKPNRAPVDKQRYLPENIWMVPKGNDFTNDSSEFSNKRMVESNDVAIYWSKEFGTDLSKNTDSSVRLDLKQILKECNRFYNFYVDSLGFVNKGRSVTDRYKLLAFVFKGKENTAFGGGEDKKVGIVWTPLARITKAPYGALAHEIGHSFQYLVHADGAWAFTSAAEGSHGQPIFEMTSQYMLWHVYPEWMTFENYHLQDYLKKTHYAFLHETNQYHSPYVLEYWSNKHGLKFIGKLWQQAVKGEDPVMTYKRITNTSQSKFNDEMHQAAAKFITWDLDQAKKTERSYANQHRTLLEAKADGWFQVLAGNCPQNYGYNGIQLKVPAGKTRIKLEFKGLAGGDGFRKINVADAGWRYSFLAVKQNGERVYGQIHAYQDGAVDFVMPKETQYLWLVVSGAPATHWEHITDGKEENDEQWPYKIRLTGTTLL
ncbi:hypothetical protein GJU39_17785 [Pedobacter petrophilus]|uniref:Avirulence protein n=1 Tax=Pedobacter petrophilus TaxID=1908241 RepID=A0A7K0G3H4_9SPHI|nr:DUF6055 domain-containing protein [Pedobacter petrophilus]MRX77934.1 hypothetical protein [Pedobacter petrophilus]